MKIAAIVTVATETEAALSGRAIAGRPWIAHLTERLASARSVSRVAVVAHADYREAVAPLVGPAVAVIGTREHPWTIAAALDGDHDAFASCPVTQLFADPQRLDELASVELARPAARIYAAIPGDPSFALTGGAFLQVLTRRGLQFLLEGNDQADLEAVAWPASPEPPEMRLETADDFEWAVAAYEALLGRDPSGAVETGERAFAHFDELLAQEDLGRFGFWNRVGVQPLSILTVRCLRQPLFEWLVRYLTRIPFAAIDVVCPAATADVTAAIPGVRRVIPFDAAGFHLAALGQPRLEMIRSREYDLCVVPRHTPSGYGFDNVTALGPASGARTAIWLDLFGRSGLLAGRPGGWDSTNGRLPPHDQAEVYRRRGKDALEAHVRRERDRSIQEVLRRLDEHLSCRALLENPDSGIDLGTALLYQMPAVIELNQRIDRIAARAPKWAPRLIECVDSVFRSLVTGLADRAPGLDPSGLCPPHITAAVARLGSAVGTLDELTAGSVTGVSPRSRVNDLLAGIEIDAERLVSTAPHELAAASPSSAARARSQTSAVRARSQTSAVRARSRTTRR